MVWVWFQGVKDSLVQEVASGLALPESRNDDSLKVGVVEDITLYVPCTMLSYTTTVSAVILY